MYHFYHLITNPLLGNLSQRLGNFRTSREGISTVNELTAQRRLNFSENDLKSGSLYSFRLSTGTSITFQYKREDESFRIHFPQRISFLHACADINVAFTEKYPNDGIAVWTKGFESLNLNAGFYFHSFKRPMKDYPETASFILLLALCRLAHNEKQEPFNPCGNIEFLTDLGIIVSVSNVLGVSKKVNQ